MKISDVIIKLMHEDSYRNLSIDELSKILGFKRSEQDEIKKVILELFQAGVLIKDRKNRYGLAEKNGYHRGIISINSKGYGFISHKDGDIFVAPPDVNYAMDGDEVLYKVSKSASEGLRSEGYVKSIIKRNTDIIVGRFTKNKNFGFVVPEDRRIQYDIYIPKKLFNNAKHGDIVSCRILRYPERRKKPEGMVTAIIGKERNLKVDIQSELIKRKIPEDFPIKVKKYCSLLDHSIEKEEQKREIFEGLIFTIDGSDAKDLDDAISIKQLNDGTYELGVYIADVSHYVKEKSPLDKEALSRGTSIYFADRVIPMLPEVLSNDLCSLQPNQKKLVLALVMQFDKNGKLMAHRVIEGVIKSKYRLTYDDVSDYLEHGTGNLSTLGDKDFLASLCLAKDLSKLIRQARQKRGSIDFDFPEVKYHLHKNRVIDVSLREMRTANRIIEDFMIIANETIAESFFLQDVPFLFRVHEMPNIEKLEPIYQLLDTLGIKPKRHKDGKVFPNEIQKVMNQIIELPEKDMIQYSLLRSMQKARYSSTIESHFGLASKYYTHFTSPIRRYPDLQIHRIIKEIINGRLTTEKIDHYLAILPDIADVSSSTEMRAIDFERTIDDILACYYMMDHIGTVFDGKIVNFTNFGIFILLSNSIEGLIRYTDIINGYPNAILDVSEMAPIIKEKYQIGDWVKVKVDKVDFIFREIILSFEEI